MGVCCNGMRSTCGAGGWDIHISEGKPRLKSAIDWLIIANMQDQASSQPH